MLLSFGASAYRVKKSMADVARAVGISEHRAQVTYTEIITTAYASGTFRTELAEQRLMGVNADKIDRINKPATTRAQPQTHGVPPSLTERVGHVRG